MWNGLRRPCWRVSPDHSTFPLILKDKSKTPSLQITCFP
uniref:Uncharacterized protein n=1 Tax=Anguilla anguilla TaxID=7936 RepID=A0A0E9UHK2_ANGAN